MNSIEPGPLAEEVRAYRGRGTQGWRVEADDQAREFIVIEAGASFGGEWSQLQEWQILEGRGSLTWDAPFKRVRVSAGERYRFELGERRLLRADTAMRILITSVE